MCGIVGGVSDRNVLPILIEGLKGWNIVGMILLELLSEKTARFH